MDPRWLQRVVTLLFDKRQVIFYGPPGTGKTYAALTLANGLARSEDRVSVVQFHPSYSYEDFVQGFRPTQDSGATAFALRNGPLLELARKAAATPDRPHFLVIDEINRGNIAAVFGELYFLLEYRERPIRLQYADVSDPEFTLPRNLFVVGTMNSSDRSIALVDGALRRRFYFLPFFPLEPPVAGLLSRWLAKHNPAMAWVADLVDVANRKLNQVDRGDAAIGPSYFMKKNLDDDWLEMIWDFAVVPYLEEQLLGDSDLLGEFTLPRLRAEAEEEPSSPQTESDESAPELDGS